MGCAIRQRGDSSSDRAARKRKILERFTLEALKIPLVSSVPQDDHKQIATTVGLCYTPGNRGTTVLRGGFGLYFDDLAQNGLGDGAAGARPGAWIVCRSGAESWRLGKCGCVAGDASGGTANLIDSNYKTPYAIHISGRRAALLSARAGR